MDSHHCQCVLLRKEYLKDILNIDQHKGKTMFRHRDKAGHPQDKNRNLRRNRLWRHLYLRCLISKIVFKPLSLWPFVMAALAN